MPETLGQNIIKIPWVEGLKLGDGFRQFERAIVGRSAVEPFEVDTSASLSEDITLRSSAVADAQSMSRQIDTSLRVEAPIYGVPMNIETGFMDSAEYSDTTMTTFIEMTIKDEQRMYKTLPSLTLEATEILNRDANEFRKDYGDYFVAGYIAQSSLVASCTFTAKTREELDQFKLKAGANLEPVNVNGAVSLSKTAESMGINIKLTAHMVGFNMKPDSKGINTSEIGHAHTAILVGFPTLNLKAVSFGTDNKAFDGLEGSFKDIYKLLDRVRHAPNRRAREDMEEKVHAHAKKLQQIVSQGDVAPKLEAWRCTYEEYVREYRVWQERQQAMDDLHSHIDTYRWPGQKSSTSESDWISANNQAEWEWGQCCFPAGSSLSRELTSESINYDRSWMVGAHYSGDLTITGGNKIIIGYKVISHWQDGTNGKAHIF